MALTSEALKMILKNFYCNPSVDICEKMEQYKLNSNLIFLIPQDFSMIKHIVTSLVFYNNSYVNFRSSGFQKFFDGTFNKDEHLAISEIAEMSKYLILYEVTNINFTEYQGMLINKLLGERLMQNNKYTMMFFSTFQQKNVVEKQLSNQFTVVDMRDKTNSTNNNIQIQQTQTNIQSNMSNNNMERFKESQNEIQALTGLLRGAVN